MGNLLTGGTFFGSKALAVVGFSSSAKVGLAIGFTGSALTTWTGGGSFIDGLANGFRAGVQGALIGAAVGGVTGGIRANKEGLNFWDGKKILQPQQPIKITPVGIKKLNPKIEMSTDIIDAKPTVNNTELISKPGFDIDTAVNYLDENAKSSSTGCCAKYVRKALQAGGIKTKMALLNGKLSHAWKYENFLPDIGFSELSVNSYTPSIGDIVVFGKSSLHTSGHILMFNGTNWVSDFIQKTFFPWRSSNYKIYRW